MIASDDDDNDDIHCLRPRQVLSWLHWSDFRQNNWKKLFLNNSYYYVWLFKSNKSNSLEIIFGCCNKSLFTLRHRWIDKMEKTAIVLFSPRVNSKFGTIQRLQNLHFCDWVYDNLFRLLTLRIALFIRPIFYPSNAHSQEKKREPRNLVPSFFG